MNLNGLDEDDFGGAVPSTLSAQVTKINNYDAKGAIVNNIFGANNLNGSPRGHIKVHVFATQNRDKADIGKSNKYPQHLAQGENETTAEYLARVASAYTEYPLAITSAISDAQNANTYYINATDA